MGMFFSILHKASLNIHIFRTYTYGIYVRR